MSEVVYDFKQPFTRITMADAVIQYNPDFDPAIIQDFEYNIEKLKEYAKQVGIKEEANPNRNPNREPSRNARS